jgi:beta-lactamase superfamily II metal-dependent hydrolase
MSEITFHFLNVGKGNCTIIEFPPDENSSYGRLSVIDIDDSRALSKTEKLTMLLEKKASLTNPIDYITSRFPNREIFRFILTHPDMDHMSGIKSLFNKKPIWNFWDTENKKYIDPDSWENSPYDKEDWDFYQDIRQRDKNPKVLKLYRDAKSECCWTQDGIRVLAPTEELVREANESEEWDHLSYVLMIEYAGKKFLLGGDATEKVWEDIINYPDYEDYLESDVLFAPGHGSPNHISKKILDVIKPKLIVVSVAEGVDYARELYSKYGIVLSTKYYGNIWIKIKDTGEVIFKTQFQKYSGGWHRL